MSHPSASLTLAVQDKDGVDWVNSTWKDSALRVIMFKLTSGLV